MTLGEELGTLHHQSLEPFNHPFASITDFEFLCSYTWARSPESKRPTPAICVPGDAPKFLLHDLPMHANESKHKIASYRDANLARFRDAPWRPMFRALDIMRPGYKLDDVDVIINRSTLQNILYFVDGRSNRDFRLDVAKLGNTLLVTPVLRSAHDRNQNFGRVFEQNFTQGCTNAQNSGTHHRVIRYKIGPLNCVVLFECDAQIEPDALKDTVRPGWLWVPPRDDSGGQELHDSIVEELAPKFAKERAQFSKINPASIWKATGEGYLGVNCHVRPFNVIHNGKGTPSSHIAELATGQDSKTMQMWMGRTPVS